MQKISVLTKDKMVLSIDKNTLELKIKGTMGVEGKEKILKVIKEYPLYESNADAIVNPT